MALDMPPKPAKVEKYEINPKDLNLYTISTIRSVESVVPLDTIPYNTTQFVPEKRTGGLRIESHGYLTHYLPSLAAAALVSEKQFNNMKETLTLNLNEKIEVTKNETVKFELVQTLKFLPEITYLNVAEANKTFGKKNK
jgi:hypothetical protein